VLFGSGHMVHVKGRETHGPSNLLLFSFDLDNFAAFVVPTVGANTVRKAHFSAIWANDQVVTLQRIVGAPAIASAR
jgi:hypothetical protein